MDTFALIKEVACARSAKVQLALVAEIFPRVYNDRSKGRKPDVVGQGELKAGGFDSLFALNHSCAMIRDNIKAAFASHLVHHQTSRSPAGPFGPLPLGAQSANS